MDPDPLLINDIFSLGLVALLLLCSALISGSEVAFFSLKPKDLDELDSDSRRSSNLVLKLLREPHEKEGPRNLLATILVLNNLINIAIVLIATVKAEEIFPSNTLPNFVSVAIHIAGVTLLIVLFGEVIPKLYANSHNLRVSRFMAGPLVVLQRIFKPLWMPLVSIGQRLDKRIAKYAGELSVDDLSKAVELTDNVNRSVEEKEILERIVKFGDKDAKQIMTPRTDVVAFSLEEPWLVLRSAVVASGFSRIPIHKGSMDEVVGVLHIKDLIPLLELETAVWTSLLREPYFITENMKIDDLLREFQERKVHMALVVDEYGGTSGLITLEDVLEEIVGDITDEFDVEEMSYSQLDENTFVMEAKTALIDFYRVLEIDEGPWEESKGESDTIGGFMMEQAGKIPHKGEHITFKNIRLMVDAGDNRKIDRVKIEVLTQKSEE
ncbi:MAG: magnesium/cobalt efflux protein [Crocinitomicaceae bacterium]|nr:magnesium/cobalt efflux protein [Crocinitomicaceae bacterium]|tara:strand:+ start:13969 stop:15282 length:1314 start_codon:yes stop_codon:yes gene_type:complete